MASGFFAILDDIAALMDDVAVNAKLATKKTAGILGDDLAVNAEKSTGFVSSREIPVLWAITKGSFLNKLIIVPIALLLNVFLPAAIKIVLLLGGFYLAYEGMEKIVEYFFHKKDANLKEMTTEGVDDRNLEKAKIKSAITTDFILSVEIVIIALSTVLDESLYAQIITVCIVSIIATVGVYGFVALIVRMDDFGFMLMRKSGEKGLLNSIGLLLVKTLPLVIQFFAIVGTIALILVSGGIFSHNIDYLHHFQPTWPSMLKETIYGVLGGLLTILIVTLSSKVISVFKK
jgi:predicted DNA repair protein MutK